MSGQLRRGLGARAGARAWRGELEPEALLPFSRHVTSSIIALDTGALMMSVRLDGASFETADTAELNAWHTRLNLAWRNLASDDLAIWHHIIRSRAPTWPDGRFSSAFAAELDQAYRARVTSGEMFLNALFVTLVLHPSRTAGALALDAASRLARRLDLSVRDRGEPDEAERVRRLEEAGRDLEHHLSRYGPTRLGLIERGGLWRSEPMGLLRQILGGEAGPAPLVRGHLGSAIYTERVIFGREALEIREPGGALYGGLFGIKEYPASTRPGVWNGLLSAPFCFVATQSFSFLSKTAAKAVMSRKQNQMASARDAATSQIAALSEGLDDLTSNRFVMGEHHASLMVLAKTPRALGEQMSAARALLADAGLVAAREDLGLEAGFWAQFPGAFKYRVRPAAISSRNFAALAPFHAHPTGKASGNHWGAAVALLRSAAGSPFYFNFHVGDVGHTFICGPSGSGKTVVQNFLLAQLEKLAAQVVLVDKDRGAEIFVRACGGTYLALKPGEPTGFAPFKALAFTPANRVFLASLVRQLVAPSGERLSAQEERAIDEAVGALAPLEPRHRSISALRALLGQSDAGGVGARLERWQQGCALGWVLDNESDALGLEGQLLGFDVTHFLDHPEVRAPIMAYLFHRLTSLVDGRRLVINIDEFWKALADEAFCGLAEDGLKTFRKQNAFMVFSTQSPADVLRSRIAHTILEQCSTKIFLPNPAAQASDYMGGFGLSRREFELVRSELGGEQRQFLVKQGLNSLIAELRLDGLCDHLAVLSGRTESVELLERLRALHGDAYADWAGPFHQSRKGQT
jgi:type IV secretion system protein VirB4